MNKGKSVYPEIFLSLEVGESAKFPISKYNSVRNSKYQNPQILEARASGKEFSVRYNPAEKATVVTRTR